MIGPLTAILALPSLAGPPASAPDFDVDVEVLTVSVSKLARDTFGNPVSPFSFVGLNEADPGVSLLAKITPRGLTSVTLLQERTWVVSFTDDVGTDLSTNAAPRTEDRFFPRNRPLEILTDRGQGLCHGLRLRSSRLPAPGATRLIADVVLVFRASGEEQADQKTNVRVQTNDVVKVGPLRVKFTVPAPNPHAPKPPPAAIPQGGYWRASFLPRDDVAIASVTFFSKNSDEPILVAKNINPEGKAASASTGMYSQNPKKDSAGDGDKDPFAKCVGYGFKPPEDGKITIKVRYCDVGSLVEKHCLISTGLSP